MSQIQAVLKPVTERGQGGERQKETRREQELKCVDYTVKSLWGRGSLGPGLESSGKD